MGVTDVINMTPTIIRVIGGWTRIGIGGWTIVGGV